MPVQIIETVPRGPDAVYPYLSAGSIRTAAAVPSGGKRDCRKQAAVIILAAMGGAAI